MPRAFRPLLAGSGQRVDSGRANDRLIDANVGRGERKTTVRPGGGGGIHGGNLTPCGQRKSATGGGLFPVPQPVIDNPADGFLDALAVQRLSLGDAPSLDQLFGQLEERNRDAEHRLTASL